MNIQLSLMRELESRNELISELRAKLKQAEKAIELFKKATLDDERCISNKMEEIDTLKEKFNNEQLRADILDRNNENLQKEISELESRISELEEFEDVKERLKAIGYSGVGELDEFFEFLEEYKKFMTRRMTK